MWEIPLASWQALKMTLSSIPGICLVIWAAYVGRSRKRARIRDLWLIWDDTSKAKTEGLKEVGRMFLFGSPLLGYLLFTVALFLIPIDTILLMVINICAFPTALLSYREGYRTAWYQRETTDLYEFDPPWPYLLKIAGVWLGFTAAVLSCLRAFDLWHPA